MDVILLDLGEYSVAQGQFYWIVVSLFKEINTQVSLTWETSLWGTQSSSLGGKVESPEKSPYYSTNFFSCSCVTLFYLLFHVAPSPYTNSLNIYYFFP